VIHASRDGALVVEVDAREAQADEEGMVAIERALERVVVDQLGGGSTHARVAGDAEGDLVSLGLRSARENESDAAQREISQPIAPLTIFAQTTHVEPRSETDAVASIHVRDGDP
jgi:hypothetical protein